MNPLMHAADARRQPPTGTRPVQPRLAVIIPTYNERENVAPMVCALAVALEGTAWEAIFVDDDSPDGTHLSIALFAREDTRIRLLHRIGRRGLSSACVEGVLSTTAEFVAVMDGDLQHDESVLPAMLERLERGRHDLVVATRNSDGGSVGQFSRSRCLLSRLGKAVSRSVLQTDLSDPMSGFFMVRRVVFLDAVHKLHGGGFKILLDLLASSPRTLRTAEVGYTFRSRCRGESKLSVAVGMEFLSLIVHKVLGGFVPLRIALFGLVGALGVLTHLGTLFLLVHLGHIHFGEAQVVATMVALLENFLLNNRLTFRDCSLRGSRLLPGLLRFFVVCAIGAWLNMIVARSLWQSGAPVYAAGLAGILLGSVWNLSISSAVTWHTRPDADLPDPATIGC